MSKLALWFIKTRFYKWLLFKIIPFIRFSVYYAPIRGNKYHAGYKLLEPGDIILTDDEKKLTSILIKGKFSHLAVCVDKGPDCEYEIAEMTNKNFTKSWFFDICKEASRVVILRNPRWGDGYKMQFCDRVKAEDKSLYDGQFENDDNENACVELPIKGDYLKTIRIEPEFIKLLNRHFPTPDSFYKSPDLITIWDSDNEKNT